MIFEIGLISCNRSSCSCWPLRGHLFKVLGDKIYYPPSFWGQNKIKIEFQFFGKKYKASYYLQLFRLVSQMDISQSCSHSALKFPLCVKDPPQQLSRDVLSVEKQRGPLFFVMYKRCSKSFHNVEICFGDLLGAKGRQVGGLFSRSSTKLLFFGGGVSEGWRCVSDFQLRFMSASLNQSKPHTQSKCAEMTWQCLKF